MAVPDPLSGARSPAQNLLMPALAIGIGLSALIPGSLVLTAVAVVALVVTLEVGTPTGAGAGAGPANVETSTS